MPNSRTIRTLLLAVLLGLTLGLAACGTPKPAPAGPPADNSLSIVITNDGQIQIPVQELFTDKPATLLRLNVQSHGGNVVSDGKMYNKIITIVSTERTDQTSNMSLGSLSLIRVDTGLYSNTIMVLLPLGTYGFMIDGQMTKAIIKVSAKSPAK